MRTPYWMLGFTLLAACLSPEARAAKVKVFPDPKAHFSDYKTYQWYPPKVMTRSGIDENHPAAPILMEVVGEQLKQKGLREVADGADLKIQAFVVTESSPQVEAVIINAVGVAPGTYMTLGTFTTIGRYNREGSLYLNIIDSQTKKTAWFGMVTDSLPNGVMSPSEIRGKLNKASAALFKKYPK